MLLAKQRIKADGQWYEVGDALPESDIYQVSAWLTAGSALRVPEVPEIDQEPPPPPVNPNDPPQTGSDATSATTDTTDAQTCEHLPPAREVPEASGTKEAAEGAQPTGNGGQGRKNNRS